MTLKRSQEHERLTIYLGGMERRKLLDWVKRFTKASSDSEAIFSALELVRRQALNKYKSDRTSAIRKARGKWAKDANIAEAFAEVEKGWTEWDRGMSL